MSTTRINMQEAKTHLSAHIAKLAEGDRIILCRRNRPVAEIRPIQQPMDQARPVGLGRGLAEVPESFFDPLPEHVLESFEARPD
jgi:antitoxin (DNA-binding transcriptional repressor) of toxin-antitoxin stability system